MKLIRKITAYGVLFCLLLSAGNGMAATPKIIIQLTIGSKFASVNGKDIELDVPSMVVNGRTLVPLRFIGQALGSTIDYDALTRTIKITAPDGVLLEKNILEMESEIASLKKQLENMPSGIQSETVSPEIIISNIADNQVITKATILNITINDQSPIAYVRTKIGNLLLSENPKNMGTIEPSKLLSGTYPLLIEVWDAFGNRGEKRILVTIQNTDLVEPIILKAEAKEMKRGGPPGGGGGENPMKLATLAVDLTNNSLSTLEIIKVEAFDKDGNLKQPRTDGGVVDMLKRQSGMNHIFIIPSDSISLQAANAPVEEGQEIKDVYKGWKVVITFFDSIQQKEITKTVTLI